MLKDLFDFTIMTLRPALAWMLPYYPYYLIAVFLALTAYLLFAAVRSGVKGLGQVTPRSLAANSAFLAALFLLMCLAHKSFMIFSDEKMYFQLAAEYARTGKAGLLLSNSIMPFFYALTLKLGGLTFLKGLIFLLMSLHFLLWKLILEDLFGVGTVLAASSVFLCAVLCISSSPDIVSYMSFGYVLSSSAAYLALKYSGRTDGGRVYNLLPFIALLGLVFRQECAVLFPFIFVCLLLAGAVKKGIWTLALAVILGLPMLYSLWWDELGMNAEPFDRALVAGCYSSGGPLQACYTPGISPDRSYMLNTLLLLSRLDNVPAGRVIDLAEETYSAPNPSVKNIYYNLRFRDRRFRVLAGLAFAAMLAGLAFLKSRRRQLLLLACLTGLYFLIFYLQKYSVGDFDRFDFYLFPLYFCFLTVILDAAARKYVPPSLAGILGYKNK